MTEVPSTPPVDSPSEIGSPASSENQDSLPPVKSPKKESKDKKPLSTEEMFQYFFQLYQTTLWSIRTSIFFFVTAIVITFALLFAGYSLVQKFADDQFKIYFGISMMVIASLMLVTLAQHQPLKSLKKEIKGFVRLNIIYYNYIKQMESISFLWERSRQSASDKLLADSKKIFAQMEQLTASMLGELDAVEELQDR